MGAEARRTNEIQEEARRQQEVMEARIEALQKLIAEKEELAKRSEAALLDYKLEQQGNRVQLEQKKESRKTQNLPKQFTESETRTHLIDLALREAGWDNLQVGREIEYPVSGMPISKSNPQSQGFADYVLWDDNGLPLASYAEQKDTLCW